MKPNTHTTTVKPSAMLGAGPLVSAIWRFSRKRRGWTCRFNIYRSNACTGRVSQLLRPGDVPDLVKLCQVLATTLADDGSIPARQRRKLADLAVKLDAIIVQGSRRPPGLRQEVEAIGAALVGKHEDQIILLKRKRGGGSSGRCRM